MSHPDPHHIGTRLPAGAHREYRSKVNLTASEHALFARLAREGNVRQGTLLTDLLRALANRPELLRELVAIATKRAPEVA